MERISVHVFLPDSENPYQQLQATEARQAAARLGMDVEIDFADGDFSQQVRQIFKASHEAVPPRAVAVMPVQESALKTLSETMVARGIGWVCLNRRAGDVERLRHARPGVPACVVSPDQEEIGRVHARQLRRLFPGGARILYLQGRATTSSSEARGRGLRDALAEPGPRIDIVGTLDGNWTAKDAEASLARWLKLMTSAHLHVDAIVCQSDFMAQGALAALRAASFPVGTRVAETLPVLGCDGLADGGRRLVDQGRLVSTVIVPATAGRALEALSDFYRHGRALPAEIVLAPRAYPEEASLAGPRQAWVSRPVAT